MCPLFGGSTVYVLQLLHCIAHAFVVLLITTHCLRSPSTGVLVYKPVYIPELGCIDYNA